MKMVSGISYKPDQRRNFFLFMQGSNLADGSKKKKVKAAINLIPNIRARVVSTRLELDS